MSESFCLSVSDLINSVRHLTPPATIDSKLISPFKTTNTTAASGFRKVSAPTGKQPTVIAAGSNPSTSSATALSVAWSACTLALIAVVALTMAS